MAKALQPFDPPDVAGRPHGAVVVEFERHGMRPLDDDSLAYAYKSFRDQAALWLRTKDATTDPPVWVYTQERHVVKERDPRKPGHQRYEIFTIVRVRVDM